MGAEHTDLRHAFVRADSLIAFVDQFFVGDRADFEIWLNGQNDADRLEVERLWRIDQRIADAMLEQALTGNAAASRELSRINGTLRPVGRPKGTGNRSEEHVRNIGKRIDEEFAADIARMEFLEQN